MNRRTLLAALAGLIATRATAQIAMPPGGQLVGALAIDPPMAVNYQHRSGIALALRVDVDQKAFLRIANEIITAHAHWTARQVGIAMALRHAEWIAVRVEGGRR